MRYLMWTGGRRGEPAGRFSEQEQFLLEHLGDGPAPIERVHHKPLVALVKRGLAVAGDFEVSITEAGAKALKNMCWT